MDFQSCGKDNFVHCKQLMVETLVLVKRAYSNTLSCPPVFWPLRNHLTLFSWMTKNNCCGQQDKDCNPFGQPHMLTKLKPDASERRGAKKRVVFSRSCYTSSRSCYIGRYLSYKLYPPASLGK